MCCVGNRRHRPRRCRIAFVAHVIERGNLVVHIPTVEVRIVPARPGHRMNELRGGRNKVGIARTINMKVLKILIGRRIPREMVPAARVVGDDKARRHLRGGSSSALRTDTLRRYNPEKLKCRIAARLACLFNRDGESLPSIAAFRRRALT